MSRQIVRAVGLAASWLLVTHAWAQSPATPVMPAPLPAVTSPTSLPSGQASILSLPELQALVAPVALYPDALLAQMLMAATYPLEVASATIWLQNNTLSGGAFEAALAQQRWDNSVKSLTHFPEALKMLGHQLEWTHRLGDAYLVQPSELMQAVQALRSSARQSGHLQSSSQMLVSSDPLSNIIITPTNPDIVYVPMYNPMMVYGPWPYPAYQPYPVYNPGWGAIAFGAGIGAGVALWATPYWGYGSIYINNGYYNRFNTLYNAPGYRYPARVGGASYWAYNSAHRNNLPFRAPVVAPTAQAAGIPSGLRPATTSTGHSGRSGSRRH